MRNIAGASSIALILVLFASLTPSDARGFRAVGARGAIEGVGHNFTGANGGTWKSGRGGFVTPNSGLVGGGFKGTGPNGGYGQGAGIAGWKKGVGGFEGTNMSLAGPGGSTYNGYTRGKYNAQTGQGSYNASHQAYDAKNGQTYGDTNNTTYSNGQGVTQFDTDHHGDYTIDWGKGQKPVVTLDQ